MLNPSSKFFAVISVVILTSLPINLASASSILKGRDLDFRAFEMAGLVSVAVSKYNKNKPALLVEVLDRMMTCHVLYKSLTGFKKLPRKTKRIFAVSSKTMFKSATYLSQLLNQKELRSIKRKSKKFELLMHKKDKKEMFHILRNCKSFGDKNTIHVAVQELAL